VPHENVSAHGDVPSSALETNQLPNGMTVAVMVPLTRESKLMDPSSGYLVLFEYDFKNRVLVDGKEYPIKPPAFKEGARVGYGLVYFTGQPEGALAKHVLFLLSDYNSEHAQFFVDANNNLDFSDDGPGAEFAKDGTFLVSLHPPGKLDHQFAVRLRSFRDRQGEAEAVESVHGDYIKRMGGKATKSKYWFSETRLNVMAADARVGDASFRVGVIDYDCNASYSDRGDDRILVGETGQEILSAHLSGGATTIDEETLILAQGKVFEIVEVDSAGGFLEIQPSDKPWSRLAQGMPLPSLSIELLNGEKKDLSSFVKPDHYLLLDFWGSWCGGCIAAIPDIKDLQSKWKDRLTVLGLHFGDPETARRMVQKKGVDWEQAIATKDLQERFLVDGWPSYILVGPDGKIVQLRTDPAQVGTILRSARRGD